jgi:hypothetical protein
MEQGFLVDQGYGTVTVGDWVSGEPVKSIWTGLKLKGRTRLKVSTWRCRRCGFLESYAPGAG